MDLNDDSLSDLAILSVLHDNALSRFQSEERKGSMNNFGNHCIYGEQNLYSFPFKTDTKDAILYHHERPDGKGIFKMEIGDIPLYAKLIHFGDVFDLTFNPSTKEKVTPYPIMIEKVKAMTGEEFSPMVGKTFLKNINEPLYEKMTTNDVTEYLDKSVPHFIIDYPFSKIHGIVDLFATIVDYKSQSTTSHSLGVAKKAYALGQYYGFNEEKCEKLYMAGAFHDIGKMAINNSILEKPAKLTDSEYKTMKTHVHYSYEILKNIKGFDDICEWASSHHEKLNGKGYPFGKTADELSKEDRMMACIDIFQALSEDRSYKTSLPKEQVRQIMDKMVERNEIDGQITADLFNVFADSFKS